MMEEYIEQLIGRNDSAFYVFDIEVLKDRVQYLKKQLPRGVRICYAVKANPFVIKELESQVERFECCSPGEARICKSLGIGKKKMVISGVYKTPDFIESLVSDRDFTGVFTAESTNQLSMISELSEKYGRKVNVLLRLTNDSQFGMNASEIEKIIQNRTEIPGIIIAGIQFFSGTQKHSVKKMKREIEMLDSFLTTLKSDYGFEAEELEYGPGFPISYFSNEEYDEYAHFEAFFEIIQEMKNRPAITVELGRSVPSSCGKYFTKIVDIKTNNGQNYIIVDGGMHHLVYFGQYMAMKMPVISVVGKEGEKGQANWNICGALCSMNDIMAKHIALPPVQVGDVLCFENTGAYCFAEGPALFLSRELPPIYFRKENSELYCVRSVFETAILNTPHYERIR